jgi:DNA-binding Lrp family transcriptional regulator
MASKANKIRRRPNGIDLKIISQLLESQGEEISTAGIAKSLEIPLSTIQRRIRKIMDSGIVKHRYELDFNRFGLKKGLLQIHVGNGKKEIFEVADQVSRIGDGLISVSIHLGNSDIVCEYACKNSHQIVEILSKIRMIDGVKDAIWSEQVYQHPLQGQQRNLLRSLSPAQ